MIFSKKETSESYYTNFAILQNFFIYTPIKYDLLYKGTLIKKFESSKSIDMHCDVGRKGEEEN